METNMSCLIAQINIYFDQITKLKGNPKEGDHVFGEGSHKGKLLNTLRRKKILTIIYHFLNAFTI
jgi:hypothetical protein